MMSDMWAGMNVEDLVREISASEIMLTFCWTSNGGCCAGTRCDSEVVYLSLELSQIISMDPNGHQSCTASGKPTRKLLRQRYWPKNMDSFTCMILWCLAMRSLSHGFTVAETSGLSLDECRLYM